MNICLVGNPVHLKQFFFAFSVYELYKWVCFNKSSLNFPETLISVSYPIKISRMVTMMMMMMIMMMIMMMMMVVLMMMMLMHSRALKAVTTLAVLLTLVSIEFQLCNISFYLVYIWSLCQFPFHLIY